MDSLRRKKDNVNQSSQQQPTKQSGLPNNLSEKRHSSNIIKFVLPIILIIIAASAGAFFYFYKPLKKEVKPDIQEKSIDLFAGFSKLVISTAYAEDNFELKPTKSDSLGVAVNTTYILTSKEEVKTKLIKEHLIVEPDIKYIIEQISVKEWEITPQEQPGANTLIKIALATSYQEKETGEQKERNYSWVYQVKDSFKVLHSIPRDAGVDVPLNTGIEVTFSHDNFIDYNNYFTINPQIEGRFEKHGRTLVFIPTDTLKAGSLYTVTIKQDLPLSDSNEKLSEDYSFTFETKPEKKAYRGFNQQYFYVYQHFIETNTKYPPIIEVSTNKLTNNYLDVGLYQFLGWQEYLTSLKERDKLPWWSYSKEDFWQDTSELTLVKNYNLEIKKEENNKYIEFPENLLSGFYLIELTHGELKQQVWLQVSDLSVYYNITKTDTIFWINSSDLQSPVQGAKIELLNTDKSFTTTRNGIAQFPTPEFIINESQDKKENKRNYFKISYANNIIIVPASQISRSYYWYGSSSSEDYWYYLYTDRPRYQTTDVIKYWGLLLDRDNKKINDKITVALNKEGYVDYYYQPVRIVEQEVSLTDNNTFSGEIKFKNLRPDHYTLELKIGDEVIKLKYVSIKPYIKPAYQLELIPEKKYAFAGDVIELKGKASFFEGTPVPGLKLVYETPSGEEIVTTDDQGEIELSYTKEYYECTKQYGCWPEYETVSIRPEESELAEISASNYLRFYGAKVYLEAERKYPEQGKAEIKMTTKYIDLDKLNQDYSRWPGLGDEIAPFTKINIEVTKITYTKKETGTYYDFINKKTYKKYSYQRNEEAIDNLSVTTDREGEYVYQTIVEPESSYKVRIKVFDNEGRYQKYNNYLYYYTGNYIRNYNDWRFSYYHLKLPEDKTSYQIGEEVEVNFMHNDEPMPEGERRYLYMQLQNGLQEYSVANNYEYRFNFENRDIPNVNLSAVYFNGVSYITTASSYWGRSVNFNYKQRDLLIDVKTDKEQYQPGEKVKLNITVTDIYNQPVKSEVNLNLVDEAYYAVISDHASPLESIYHHIGPGSYFQRKTHESVSPKAMEAERGGCFAEGTLILMADNSQKPIEDIEVGDEVKTFSDPISMKFNQGEVTKIWQHFVAEYMIINDQLKVTPEHQVYSNYRFTDVGSLKTGDWLLNAKGEKTFIKSIKIERDLISVYNLRIEPQHTYFAQGIYVHNQEKGGGPREFFTDAALFQNIITNSFGKAQTSFTLPDNITSWRVTAQAISKNLYAGVSVSKIPVSLPVFTEVTIGDEYLVEDKPVVRMRAFGVALKSGDRATFTIEAPTLTISNPQPFEDTAFQPVYYNLPDLILGKHSIVYNLETDEGKDAIKLPLNVISSRLEAQVAKSEKLTTKTKIVAENDLPIAVVLIDQGQNQLYRPLQRLSWSWGDRVDQKLIRKQARLLLNKYYNEEYILPNFNAFNYQVPSGGITLLPYSSEELELSARVVAIGATDFDKESLSQYFFKIIEDKNSNPEEVSLALFGLASLKKPILPRIHSWLKRDGLSAKELLYLAQALFDLGAYEQSRELYHQIMSEYAEVKEPYYIVRVSENMDEVFHATALAAVLAASLNMPQAQGMFDYLIENQVLYGRYKNSESLFNLEKYSYIDHTLPNLKPSPARVVLELFGEEKEVKLTGGSIYSFQIEPQQVDQVKFTSIEGDVGISMNYTKPFDLATVSRDNDISIAREYYVNGVKTNRFKEKDTIQVRLYPSFSAKALRGEYQITDILPSGLMQVTKLYQRDYSYDCHHWYPYNTDGQMVKYRISKDWKNWYCGGNYFYYYARVKNKGEYKAEPAIIQSFVNPEYINYSNTEKIIIE